MKAMILAAGFGTRLKPFTLHAPKPLHPVNGIPLIYYNLALLKHNGIRDVWINLHHKGSQIKSLLGNGKTCGMTLHYSQEAEILGTGGGIARVMRRIQDDLLVLNGDILTDINLKSVLTQKKHSSATLVLKQRPDASTYGLIYHEKHRVTDWFKCTHSPVHQSAMFTGIHCLSYERLKDRLHALPHDKPSCIIRDGYIPEWKHGAVVETLMHKGLWIVCDKPDDVQGAESTLQKITLSYQTILNTWRRDLYKKHPRTIQKLMDHAAHTRSTVE